MPRLSAWTRDTALAAGTAFVEAERRYPTQVDTLAYDLPQWETLAKLFGSLAAFHALLPPPRREPPPRPRPCLKCAASFRPAHRGLFVCNPCKADPAWQETLDWLGVEVPGTVVRQILATS